MEMIKQIKYNKINCTGCGDYTTADLAAFDFGKIFSEAIGAGMADQMWESLVRIDLKFYYTLRDICQELDYSMNKDSPAELTLCVRNVRRQLEFLLNDVPFSSIQNEARGSVMYNTLYRCVRSDYGTPDEVMSEIEVLIRNLASVREDMVILKVPVRMRLSRDADGNEMAAGVEYYIGGEKRELPCRVCPQCGTPLDWLAGYRDEFIIGLAGLPRVGKTALIASLIHQLRKLGDNDFIHIKKNASESLAGFERDIVSKYEEGKPIQKTEVANIEAIPLVYVPLQIRDREYNFVFVDIPGEVFSGSDSDGLDFISNNRTILKCADVVWCCIEPAMINSSCKNAGIEEKKEDSSKQLSGLTRILDVVYSMKVPAGIVVTQSDLISPEYSLYRPDIDVMREFLLDDYSLDFTKMNEFAKRTGKFIDEMRNFRLSIEGIFEGTTMFSVASYGFDVSESILLSNKKLQPSLVELPFLWTLAKLGLMDATKFSSGKNLLGKEKMKRERVNDTTEMYFG